MMRTVLAFAGSFVIVMAGLAASQPAAPAHPVVEPEVVAPPPAAPAPAAPAPAMPQPAAAPGQGG